MKPTDDDKLSAVHVSGGHRVMEPTNDGTIRASVKGASVSGQPVVLFGWPRLLSIEVLAQYIGCGAQTIRNRAAKGDIPGRRKLGRRTFFDRVEIDLWLDQCVEYRDAWLDGRKRVR